MYLKSKKHLNLVGVAAVGCELEVVWLFYNRLRSAGEVTIIFFACCLLETTLSAAYSAICSIVALRDRRRVHLHSTVLWRIRQYNF